MTQVNFNLEQPSHGQFKKWCQHQEPKVKMQDKIAEITKEWITRNCNELYSPQEKAEKGNQEVGSSSSFNVESNFDASQVPSPDLKGVQDGQPTTEN